MSTLRSCDAREAGFTLVEALLATLLMAVILGALAMLTGQWLPNWNRGMDRLQQTELLAAGMDRLLADLAAAEIVSGNEAEAPPIFDGTELAVTFVRTAFGPNAVTGLEVVRIAEVGRDGGLALVRATAPFVPTVQDAATATQLQFGNPVVLARAPYRVSFSYAGPDGVWRANWRGLPQMPRAIRVNVRDGASFRTLAASTSTLVRAELPARCVVATRQAECPMMNMAVVRTDGAGGAGSLPGTDMFPLQAR